MAMEKKHHPNHHILLAIIITALIFGIYGFYIGQASVMSNTYTTSDPTDYTASGVQATATATPTASPTTSATPTTTASATPTTTE